MRTVRWLAIALLLCLLPACGFVLDDDESELPAPEFRAEPTTLAAGLDDGRVCIWDVAAR